MPDEPSDGAKIGMLADLGIERHLQRHEVELPVQSVREPPEHGTLSEAIERLAPRRPQPGKRLRQPQGAVMSIVGKPGTPDGGGDVIQGRPQSRVAEGAADFALCFPRPAREVAIELCLTRHQRKAVDSELLEGNEVGPDVALFEGAHPDAILLRDAAGHAVNWPAIAEQQHDVDPSFFQQTRKELRPVAMMATPADRAGGIKGPIAAVAADLVDLR